MSFTCTCINNEYYDHGAMPGMADTSKRYVAVTENVCNFNLFIN